MVVLPTAAPVPVRLAPTRRRSAASGFTVADEPAPMPGSPPVAGAATAGLLALQEDAGPCPDPAARDRAALRHGEALLQDLAALQSAVLGGRAGALRRRAGALDAGPQAADAGLAGVLDAIRTRAAVELARAALRPGSDTENSFATTR